MVQKKAIKKEASETEEDMVDSFHSPFPRVILRFEHTGLVIGDEGGRRTVELIYTLRGGPCLSPSEKKQQKQRVLASHGFLLD